MNMNAWREGDVLVVYKLGGVLPDRCVVCDAPARGYKLTKTFYWHPSWVYLMFCIGVLTYFIVALIVRTSGTVDLGLCEKHRNRRRDGLILVWAGFGLGFLLLFVAVANDWPHLFLPCIAMIAVLPIAGGLMARVATLKQIDEVCLRLKVGQPFLDSIQRD